MCIPLCLLYPSEKMRDLGSQTRLGESFALFETVVNSPWFTKPTITLFLTGKDESRAKLHDVRLQEFHTSLPANIAIHYNAFSFIFFHQVPLSDYFPGYTGGTDVDECATWIIREFQRLIRRPLRLRYL
jgi:hypothetical protein